MSMLSQLSSASTVALVAVPAVAGFAIPDTSNFAHIFGLTSTFCCPATVVSGDTSYTFTYFVPAVLNFTSPVNVFTPFSEPPNA